MTRIEQKNREKSQAEIFSDFSRKNWGIVISQNEKSYPDLIIQTENSKLGLEVTEYYIDRTQRGSILKESESKHKKLLKKLQQKYYENNTIPINVKVMGRFDNVIINEVKHFLSSLNISEYSEWKEVRKEFIHPSGETALSIIRLPLKLSNFKRWDYINDHIGFVATNLDSDIRKIVKDKSMNLAKYKTHLSKVSLLIFIDHSNRSGMYSIDNLTNIPKHGFHKVYIFNYPKNFVEF